MGSLDPRNLSRSAQGAQRGILMPRGKTCRETIFAAQLPRNYPHRGGNFERGKNVLKNVGERQFARHFRRQFGCEGVVESLKLSRDSGESIFAARHQDVSQGPLGGAMWSSYTCECFALRFHKSSELLELRSAPPHTGSPGPFGPLVARAIRNPIRANRFARIIRN